MRGRTLALLVALSACGSDSTPAQGPDATVTPTPDAALGPDADTAACAQIDVGDADLATWRSDMVTWLRDRGSTGATDDGSSGDRTALRGFREPINRGAPQTQTIAWLAGLPGFMVPEAELTLIEYKSVLEGSATVVIGRARVGEVEASFHEPAAVVQLVGSGTTWEAMSVTVWPHVVLMSDSTADTLAACRPAGPPALGAIQNTQFQGLSMRGCGIVGSYTYQPDGTDTVGFDDPIEWVPESGASSARRWRLMRKATLTIAPINYWSNVNEADCYCGDVVGFALEVDALTGEVLRYTPGINCVVC